MEHTVLLEDPEVSVASRELSVAGARYALGEIRSAELVREPAPASGPVIMIVAGVLCLASVLGEAGAWGAVLGVGLLVGAGVWWARKKPSFKVSLVTGDGETPAFESPDRETAARVLAAIDEARRTA